jgi:hypothetical protein
MVGNPAGQSGVVLDLQPGYDRLARHPSTWFTYSQLAKITPMPLAWGVTHAGAKPGSGGCHASVGDYAAAAFSLLTALATDTTT